MSVLLMIGLILRISTASAQTCTISYCLSCKELNYCYQNQEFIEECSEPSFCYEDDTQALCANVQGSDSDCTCEHSGADCHQDPYNSSVLVICTDTNNPQYEYCSSPEVPDFENCICYVPGQTCESSSCLSCSQLAECTDGVLSIEDCGNTACYENSNGAACTIVQNECFCEDVTDPCIEDPYNSNNMVICTDPDEPKYLSCEPPETPDLDTCQCETTQGTDTTIEDIITTPTPTFLTTYDDCLSCGFAAAWDCGYVDCDTEEYSPCPDETCFDTTSCYCQILTTHTTPEDFNCLSCGFGSDGDCGYIKCSDGEPSDCPADTCFNVDSCYCE